MSASFTGERGTMYLRNIPKSVRDRFAATCALRNKPMNAVMVRLMKKYIKEHLTEVHVENKVYKNKGKKRRRDED